MTRILPYVRTVIFDLDGTLTRPWFDFRKIRAEIGLNEPLLERMMALPEGPERRRAFDILERYEQEAVRESALNPGAEETLRNLRHRGFHTALVTRNSRTSADGVLARHGLSFDVVVTREDAPVKPSPEPLLLICSRLSTRPADALMVGDYRFDIEAGRRAGTATCLLTNGATPSFPVESDLVIDRLPELLHYLPNA